MLKGKQGRFRQNLLGKRVDYSGRSVIVVGPELKLHQCGLPKKMALELFKPFIYNKLEERGYVTTIKSAKKMVEKERPEVWDILEEVISEHPVLLNRAPTLHRLGIQAFEPVLIEGKAIQLHPLVCAAFNADFDGDQMAVHVPLSIEAQMEARVLMMSHEQHPLRPRNGKPIIVPTQDIVLGLYYMTRERAFAKGEYRECRRRQEGPAIRRASSRRPKKCAWRTTTARSTSRPRSACRVDRPETASAASSTPRSVAAHLRRSCPKGIAVRARQQDARQEGARRPDRRLLPPAPARRRPCSSPTACARSASTYATHGRHLDLHGRHGDPGREAGAPRRGARRKCSEIEDQYHEGLITDGERYNKVVDIWAGVADKVTAGDDERDRQGEGRRSRDRQGDDRAVASTRSSSWPTPARAARTQQIRQLAGMRGLMAKPSGEIIETPITANFREGLSVLQYFISTHGARKGLADTALKTANSGYLTRRLVDVAQDAVIAEFDCGTLDGIEMTPLVKAARSSSRSATASSAAWRSKTSSIRSPAKCSSRRTTEIDEDHGQADRGRGHRRGQDPLGAHLPDQPRHLRRVLRPRPRPRPQGQHRRSGRRHRRAVDRRAGHPAHDAYVPHRRHRVRGVRSSPRSRARNDGTVQFHNAAHGRRRRRLRSWS